MGGIQPVQMKTIYAIARSLGLDSDELHALVSALTEQDSIRALGESEAAEVVTELKRRQRAAGIQPPPPRNKRAATPAKPGGVTREQQSKMWALIGELEKLDAAAGRELPNHRARLCGVIKKACGVDAAPASPFAWLDMQQGIEVIDTLKRILRSEEKKAVREGRVASG